MTLDSVTGFLREFKWFIVGAFALAVTFGLCKPECPKSISPVGETPNAVNVDKPIPDTDHSIPPPQGAYRDRQTYTHRDTVKPGDSVGTIFTTTITVYNPKSPGEPPRVESTSPVEVHYTEIREPYFDITPKWHFGVSSGYPFKVSPWLGISALTLFSRADFGVSVDMMALGVFGDVKLVQNVHLGGQFNLFKWNEGADVRVTLSLQLF